MTVFKMVKMISPKIPTIKTQMKTVFLIKKKKKGEQILIIQILTVTVLMMETLPL